MLQNMGKTILIKRSCNEWWLKLTLSLSKYLQEVTSNALDALEVQVTYMPKLSNPHR